MDSEQTIKAKARQSAQNAPKADPKTASAALIEAKESAQSRLSAQKATVLGENIHHDRAQVLSEFDDPARHTYKDGER